MSMGRNALYHIQIETCVYFVVVKQKPVKSGPCALFVHGNVNDVNILFQRFHKFNHMQLNKWCCEWQSSKLHFVSFRWK